MEKVPCHSENMKDFVDGGYFSLSNAFYGSDGETIVGGTTVSVWKREYLQRTKLEV